MRRHIRLRCRRATTLFAVAASAMLMLAPAEAPAQGWPDWADRAFGREGSVRRSPYRREAYPPAYYDRYDDRRDRGRRYDPSYEDYYDRERWGERRAPREPYPELLEGGPRPDIAPEAPPVVAFAAPGHDPNSIVIDVGARRLYYVLPGSRAYAYRISVGREGFSWTGSEKVSRKQAWPDWHPPAEMREREPHLPKKMTGGLRNPLGAMALYLGDTLYRIHGTNDERTIGRAASSGCFRMMNASVIHLASIADIGTKVSVVPSLPGMAVASDDPPRRSPPQRRPPPDRRYQW